MTTMKLLSRAQVLGANDVVFEDVACPELAPDGTPDAERTQWGVRIRNLTGAGRGLFIQRSIAMKKKEDDKEKVDFDIEMMLIAMTAVQEDGSAMFTEEDVTALGTKNAAVIARLATVAQRLSGLGKEAKDEAAKK